MTVTVIPRQIVRVENGATIVKRGFMPNPNTKNEIIKSLKEDEFIVHLLQIVTGSEIKDGWTPEQVDQQYKLNEDSLIKAIASKLQEVEEKAQENMRDRIYLDIYKLKSNDGLIGKVAVLDTVVLAQLKGEHHE